jgi:hypothetical protein
MLLLNDYLKDSTDLRLSLFVNSINPVFAVNKKNSDSIKQLISDYKLDNSKQRVKNIENYLNSAVETKETKTKRFKPSELKNMPKSELAAVSKAVIKERTEIEKKEELLLNLKRTENWNMNPALLEKITGLQSELNELYRERGDYEIKPPEATYFAIVNGFLGHWEDEGSIAYKLVNQLEPRIIVNCSMDPVTLINWLEQLSGKQIRNNYWCQSNKGYGVQSSSFKEQAIFTNKCSGLSPVKENNVSIQIDSNGTSQEVNSGVAANIIATAPSIPGTGKEIKIEYTAPVANGMNKSRLG